MPRTSPSGADSVLAGVDLYAVFARLVRLQTKLWNELDHLLRMNHAVTLGDMTSLELIASTDSCRVQDLVDVLHITVGGASKVVDRLVEAGHVIRTSNPNDRRSSVLSLTAGGRALLGRTKPDVDRILGARLAGALSASQLTELNHLLSTVDQAMTGREER